MSGRAPMSRHWRLVSSECRRPFYHLWQEAPSGRHASAGSNYATLLVCGLEADEKSHLMHACPGRARFRSPGALRALEGELEAYEPFPLALPDGSSVLLSGRKTATLRLLVIERGLPLPSAYWGPRGGKNTANAPAGPERRRRGPPRPGATKGRGGGLPLPRVLHHWSRNRFSELPGFILPLTSRLLTPLFQAARFRTTPR